MAIVTISREVAAELCNTRSITNNYDRKTAKKRIFSRIKSENGIPAGTKVKINILNEDSPVYLQVRAKRTGVALTNSLPEPTIAVVQGASVANEAKEEVKTVKEPVAKVATAVKKVAVKKAAAPAKAPAKAPAATAKAATAKPVTKVVAQPTVAAKAAVAAKPLGSPVKTAKCQIEVRTTLGGKRVRLGFASSEKMKAQMIANAKAA